jgi:hypothetical protein
VITERSVRFLSSLEAAINNPTVVEDIFSIWKRCLKVNKSLVFQSKQLEEFLLVMTRCIGLEHPEAANSHLDFIFELFNMLKHDVRDQLNLDRVSLIELMLMNPESVSNIQMNQQEIKIIQFFLNHGKDILNQYIKILLETPSSRVVDYFIDTIVELCETFHDPSCQTKSNSYNWMQAVLSEIPMTIFTADESQRLLDKFSQNKNNLRFLSSEINIIYIRAKNHNRRK